MEKDKHINLISKRLTKQQNQEEDQALDKWIEDSAENKQLAADYETIWEMSGDFEPEDYQPDVEAGLSKLKKRIDKEAGGSTDKQGGKVLQMEPRKTNTLRIWGRFAAVAAVVVVALFAWSNMGLGSVEMKHQQTAEGQTGKVQLSDGSEVELYEKSKLSYPATFRGGKRSVELEGSAFFEVVNGKENFTVSTENADISVLGTSFEVDATNGTGRTDVAVEEGVVELKDKVGGKNIKVEKDEKASLDHTSKAISKIVDSNALYRHTGKLSFNDTPFKDALPLLEKLYRVEFEVADDEILDCGLNGKFKRGELESFLRSLELSYQIEFKKLSSNKFSLSGGNCN